MIAWAVEPSVASAVATGNAAPVRNATTKPTIGAAVSGLQRWRGEEGRRAGGGGARSRRDRISRPI
jgi:hypothetical protein